MEKNIFEFKYRAKEKITKDFSINVHEHTSKYHIIL